MSRPIFQNEALLAIMVQFMFVLVLLPIIAMQLGQRAMLSFLSGGLICVLPNIYLYRRVFSHFGARAAKRMYKSLYFGELVKMLLTGAGFICALLTQWIFPTWLFMGYIAAQVGFWLAPIATGILGYRSFTVLKKIGSIPQGDKRNE